MPKIIISYRRADSDAIAGRIRDRLAKHYGDDSVFMDIDNIPFGIDFRDYIRDALFENDILVTVVGPRWRGERAEGPARIQEPTDPVRIEVEAALERGIPVIPVLVDGAVMPLPSELPNTLQAFSYRNAAEVDAGRDFHTHMDRLIRSMDRLLTLKGKLPAAKGAGKAGGAAEPGLAEDRPQHAYETVHIASVPPAEAPATAPRQEPPSEPRPDRADKPMGAPEAAAAATPPSPRPVEPKSPKRLLAIIGSVAALAAAGAAAWYFWPKPPPVVAEQISKPVKTPINPYTAAGNCGSIKGATFVDTFQEANPGWNLTDPARANHADGQLAVRPEAGGGYSVIYRALLYRNSEACLDFKAPLSAQDLGSPGAGLIFWAVDYRNYYAVVVYPDGTYLISRKVNEEWKNVTQKQKFGGLKPGLGVVNQIKVMTAGDVATVFFNGEKALDFKTQPPRGGGAVGMFAGSEKGVVTEWRFLGVAVTELPATQATASWPDAASIKSMLDACKISAPASSTLFADDFKVEDPGWRVPTGKSGLVKGAIKVRPDPNKYETVVYWSMNFQEFTLCLDLKSPDTIKNMADTGAGLVFYAADASNFYLVRLYPDGSYAINRVVNGSFVPIARKTSHDSVRKGPNAENRIKVALSGKTATLFINDARIQDFIVQWPSSNNGAIGVYGDSETNSPSEWSFTRIVLVKN